MTISLFNILTLLVNIVLYFVSFFIGLRVILRFLSANPQTPIVGWIYNVSSTLIYPFIGIFPDLNVANSVLDMVAIIALVGYIVISMMLTWLFRTLSVASDEVIAATTTHYHDINTDPDQSEENVTVHHKDHSR